MLKKIKSDVIIPLEVSQGFYEALKKHTLVLLDACKDPKETLKNITTNNKLSVDENTLKLFLSLIKEIEDKANELELTEEFEIKDSSQS
jgi:hypothetical protein